MIDAETLLNRCQGLTSKTRQQHHLHHWPQPMIIRGAAGTGKTTWMCHTFRQLLGREESP